MHKTQNIPHTNIHSCTLTHAPSKTGSQATETSIGWQRVIMSADVTASLPAHPTEGY